MSLDFIGRFILMLPFHKCIPISNKLLYFNL